MRRSRVAEMESRTCEICSAGRRGRGLVPPQLFPSPPSPQEHSHTHRSVMPNNKSSNPAKPGVERSGLVWGINRGHVNTRRTPAVKVSRRKGAQSQRSLVVKSVVREVVGFAPYERRAMELIRNSKVSTAVRVGWREGESRDAEGWRGRERASG